MEGVKRSMFLVNVLLPLFGNRSHQNESAKGSFDLRPGQIVLFKHPQEKAIVLFSTRGESSLDEATKQSLAGFQTYWIHEGMKVSEVFEVPIRPYKYESKEEGLEVLSYRHFSQSDEPVFEVSDQRLIDATDFASIDLIIKNRALVNIKLQCQKR